LEIPFFKVQTVEKEEKSGKLSLERRRHPQHSPGGTVPSYSQSRIRIKIKRKITLARILKAPGVDDTLGHAYGQSVAEASSGLWSRWPDGREGETVSLPHSLFRRRGCSTTRTPNNVRDPCHMISYRCRRRSCDCLTSDKSNSESKKRPRLEPHQI
jgi:hypothetical protein